MNESPLLIPHKGALCRVADDSNTQSFVLEIQISSENDVLELKSQRHELQFSGRDYDFTVRLFSILDIESIGLVNRRTVHDFLSKRCPMLAKRDEDIVRLGMQEPTQTLTTTDKWSMSPTFDEIWKAVLSCSVTQPPTTSGDQSVESTRLGVEGWMVLCRFVSLAQYLEAKRRFSARHLQQTMRHRNAPRGSEMVVVNVPPPEAPVSLSPEQLLTYESRNPNGLPVPELDLDHSLLAAHDSLTRKHNQFQGRSGQDGLVKISLFGLPKSGNLLSSGSTSNGLEFAVSYGRQYSAETSSSTKLEQDDTVRRSMADMKWLDDTFTAHRVLGGTLCGRILPPSPSLYASSSGSSVLSTHFYSEDSTFSTTNLKNSTGGAINAAAAGVGRMKDVAKSLIGPIGTYLTTSQTNGESREVGSKAPITKSFHQSAAPPNTHQKKTKKKRNLSLALPENYYNPNSPIGKARQLERYLNYLLEHPALSSSFPLNTILTASQCGLEAARKVLDECNRTSRELQTQTPQLDDGRSGISLSSRSPNFAWVRTAAQAAMALQVHGMLETTGMQSASARLQHASLPSFGPPVRIFGWDDSEEAGRKTAQNVQSDDSAAARDSNNFEEGVLSDDGFDLLPLPVPAPERRILTVGNAETCVVVDTLTEERYNYGAGTVQGNCRLDSEEDSSAAFLGDIAVDENIDKLREVIGSVENTFSRCLASSGRIGKTHKERAELHLGIVRGLDSWEGMRGKFVGQRSLMKGVGGIEDSKEIYEECDLRLIDDLSWQTSLANSAVAAAEDVRSAVRVSRTAGNARAAASSAAFSAESACEKGEFASLDEARAAQTRASIAQSHAIHAAVVEHEAKAVKRRATLALAHDVGTWNVHRKRETLRSCIAFARSQHEATRRSVDAWSSLRDGFIGTPVNPSIVERRTPPVCPSQDSSSTPKRTPRFDHDEVEAVIYDRASFLKDTNIEKAPSIVAVEHNNLTVMEAKPVPEESNDTGFAPHKSVDFNDTNLILPFAEAAPIPEESVEDLLSFQHSGDKSGISHPHESTHESSFNEERLSASMQSLVDGLMSWGGVGVDDEDHFALPAGMAASIVLEENDVLGKS